ncbi:DsbA family oxidoreductase [Amycolatopsis aidingensis]|uniref:DsbA family oxidoreductase n=1 Tax=Amycolatopsis aidingensis TaxID=2842453 RepID=UPI001C0D8B68|nr:DsbA family oxidoreductase [Amycolatopsis aidingensis]
MVTPRVEVILDFVCAHSYIGVTRFLRTVRQHRAQGRPVDVAFRPFRLRPEASTEGELLFEIHRRERGEAVARQIAADATVGVADGLTLNFRQAVFVNTFDAHRLLTHASAQGHGEAMAERLFRAYFTDGANIADPDTLHALATELGVAPGLGGNEELHAELESVHALGITSVPVFRFSNGLTLTGEQSEDAFLAALHD